MKRIIEAIDARLPLLVWPFIVLVDFLAVRECMKSGVLHNLQSLVFLSLANILMVWLKIGPRLVGLGKRLFKILRRFLNPPPISYPDGTCDCGCGARKGEPCDCNSW